MSERVKIGRRLPLGAVLPPGGLAAAMVGLIKPDAAVENLPALQEPGGEEWQDEARRDTAMVIPFTGAQPPAERSCCMCGAEIAPFGLGPPGGAQHWPEARRATWWHCRGRDREAAALVAWRTHYGMRECDDG